MPKEASSKEKVLQCATELFYRAGYQATSIDTILNECGVAKSNFYYHFKSKEQLALAVLEQRMADYEQRVLLPLREGALSPAKRLRHLFDSLCRTQQEIAQMGGCPFGNFAATLPTHQEDARAERFRTRLCELFHQMEDSLRDCLTEGIVRGEFRGDIAPSEMAAFLMATIQGLLIMTKTHKDTAPLISGLAIVERLLSGETSTEVFTSNS